MKNIRLGVLATFATLIALVSVVTPGLATTHAPRQAYMFLRFYDDSTIVRLELHLPDLDRALALGWDTTARPTPEQVRARLTDIRGYAEPRFALGVGPERATLVYRDFNFRGTPEGQYLLIDYVVATPLPKLLPITFTLFFELDDLHRNLVVVEHNWRTGTLDNPSTVSLILSPKEPTQTLDLTSASVFRGFLALVRLGVWHIWIGLDHILFLVALILPSVMKRGEPGGPVWRPADRFGSALFKILTIVTFFTIAHTITLSLAALGLVRVPSRIVETVIAASIAAAALHNLWPLARVNEAAIAFVFGLFHGFGFASVLGDLGLGTEHLAVSLFGFNLGVEIGQAAIISAIFPILFFARRLRVYKLFLQAGSTVLIAIGLLWVGERSMGFNVPIVPIVKAVLHMGRQAVG